MTSNKFKKHDQDFADAMDTKKLINIYELKKNEIENHS